MTPLRRARTYARKTLKEVAEALGIDPATLSRIERGDAQASARLAESLANFFGRAVSEEQILYPERFVERGAKGNGRVPA